MTLVKNNLYSDAMTEKGENMPEMLGKETPSDAVENPGRRRFVNQLTAAMGATLIAPMLPGLETALAYTPREDTLAGDGQVLTRLQLTNLRSVCQQTLPATDTPGAAEVDVHGFIDNQLAVCHPEWEWDRARRALDALQQQALEGESAQAGGAAFHELSPAQQLALLKNIEGGQKPFDSALRGDFKFLKNLLVFGYFTSKVGATELTRFDPVPGGFQGDYPFPEDGRGWF